MARTSLHSPLFRPGMDMWKFCLSQIDATQEDFPAGKERTFIDLACFSVLPFSNNGITAYDAKLYFQNPIIDVCPPDFLSAIKVSQTHHEPQCAGFPLWVAY